MQIKCHTFELLSSPELMEDYIHILYSVSSSVLKLRSLVGFSGVLSKLISIGFSLIVTCVADKMLSLEEAASK